MHVARPAAAVAHGRAAPSVRPGRRRRRRYSSVGARRSRSQYGACSRNWPYRDRYFAGGATWPAAGDDERARADRRRDDPAVGRRRRDHHVVAGADVEAAEHRLETAVAVLDVDEFVADGVAVQLAVAAGVRPRRPRRRRWRAAPATGDDVAQPGVDAESDPVRMWRGGQWHVRRAPAQRVAGRRPVSMPVSADGEWRW